MGYASSSDVISTIPKLARSSPPPSNGKRSCGIGEIRRLRIRNCNATSIPAGPQIASSHKETRLAALWRAFVNEGLAYQSGGVNPSYKIIIHSGSCVLQLFTLY